MKYEDISNSDLRNVINEWIKNERDRNILCDRLINGMCYEPLAEKYDLSVRRVKSIVSKQEMILLKHIP